MKAYALEVPFNYDGKDDALYPVILQNSTEMLLVDCGYAGFMPLIEDAANRNGLSLQQLTGVVITHHDMDHVGGLFQLKQQYLSVKVYASKKEENYINGKEKSLRLQQAEVLYPSLPEDQKPGALAFQELLKTVQPVGVDKTLSEDGASFLEGVTIINTPGHMPGHISLYLPQTKTLIAADALVVEEGELQIANPHFTLDLPEAIASVKKLQAYAIDTIICYHGGVVENNIQEKLSKLILHYS